jgi:hypothetical protein
MNAPVVFDRPPCRAPSAPDDTSAANAGSASAIDEATASERKQREALSEQRRSEGMYAWRAFYPAPVFFAFEVGNYSSDCLYDQRPRPHGRRVGSLQVCGTSQGLSLPLGSSRRPLRTLAQEDPCFANGSRCRASSPCVRVGEPTLLRTSCSTRTTPPETSWRSGVSILHRSPSLASAGRGLAGTTVAITGTGFSATAQR